MVTSGGTGSVMNLNQKTWVQVIVKYTEGTSMSNHSKFQAGDTFLVRVSRGIFHGKKE